MMTREEESAPYGSTPSRREIRRRMADLADAAPDLRTLISASGGPAAFHRSLVALGLTALSMPTVTAWGLGLRRPPEYALQLLYLWLRQGRSL